MTFMIGKSQNQYTKNFTMSDLKFNEKKIAIMQGRLVNSEKKGEIQFFPKNNGRRNWNYSKK